MRQEAVLHRDSRCRDAAGLAVVTVSALESDMAARAAVTVSARESDMATRGRDSQRARRDSQRAPSVGHGGRHPPHGLGD
jgi:hypothetical protein